MKTVALPILVLAAWAAAPLAPSRRPADRLGSLPVLHEGRLKPLDSVARSTLLVLSGRRVVRDEGRRLSPIEWQLEAAADPQAADRRPVVLIDDPDLLGLLGLEGKRFSFKALEPHLEEIERQAALAQAVDGPKRSRFQRAVLQLHERLITYVRTKNALGPEGGALPEELAAYESVLGPGLKALQSHRKAGQAGKQDLEALERLNAFFERYTVSNDMALARALPPPFGGRSEEWTTVADGLLGAARMDGIDPAAREWGAMLAAWRSGDGAALSKALAAFEARLGSAAPQAALWARREAALNRADPFTKAMTIYLLALVLAFASWAWPRRELSSGGEAALWLAFALHTFGLVARMTIEGRPPVTNLYSSAVFVGWGAALVGAVVERWTRKGFGTVVSAAVGFSTLIIASHLTASGDTMEMMRAVLDSNFWLATHVVTITLGYSGMFLAAALANVYILRGTLTSSLDVPTGRSLARTAHAVVSFSLFFSFLGTVLGGIWADQSWGRFWGWDPKENGALLIVLWCAILLHARWAGLARDRGVMLMAVGGGVLTSLSWFGVNLLGVGLHSYGFMDKGALALAAFAALQGAVIALGARRPESWKSPAVRAA